MPHTFLKEYVYYFKIFWERAGNRFFLLLLLFLLTAALDALGITMLLPLLKAAELSEDVGGKVVYFENAFRYLGLPFTFSSVIVFIGGIFIVKGVFKFLEIGYKAKLSALITRRMKKTLLERYYRTEFQYFASFNTGYFINLVNAQTSKFISSFNRLAQFTSLVVTTIVYFAIAFYLNWGFTLLALLAGGTMLFFLRYLARYVKHLSIEASNKNTELHKFMVQALQAMKFMKATGRFQRLRNKAYQTIDRLTRIQELFGMARGLMMGMREPITVISIIGIILLQVLYFEEPVAPILVTLLLFYRAMNTLLSFQGSWQSFMNSVGGVYLVLEGEQGLIQNEEKSGDLVFDQKELPSGVEFQNVSFAYSYGDQEYVLRDIDLSFEKDRTYAIVGESGAGKSTLIDLLTLMLKPTKGDIRVNGISYKDLDLEAWRERIGFVPQDSVMFDDTVANNISLWSCDPEDPECMKRIQDAARKAHCEAFIEEMDKGYHTVVGDRGIRLSGGQKQRLSIARELFRKPELLILDEATSSLDTASERYIQESIDALKGKMTVVIIAHRLSTIQNVDKIFVLEQGSVIEEGSFDELTEEMESRFNEMVEMQRF